MTSGVGSLAAGAVEMPIVSKLLDDMMDRVQTRLDAVINNAEGALLEVEMEAGRQIALAIENTKNAYVEMLDKTVDKVDKAVADSLSRIDGMIQDFQSRNTEFLEEATKKVQQFINTLPFSNLMPQLTTFKPRNVVVGGQPDQILTFSENFPYSADPKFPPALAFGEKKFSVVGSTTQEFQFSVPISDIFPAKEDSNIFQFSYKTGELQVPWDNTSNLPFWKRALGYTD